MFRFSITLLIFIFLGGSVYSGDAGVVSTVADVIAENHISRETFDDIHARSTIINYCALLDPQFDFITETEGRDLADSVQKKLTKELLADDFTFPAKIYELITSRISLLAKISHGEKSEIPATLKSKWDVILANSSGPELFNSLQHQLEEMKINRSRLIIETTLDAIAKSYDRHTRYLSAKMKESLDRKLQTSYVGIGIEMSYVAGRILIENVLPGSAAAESGQILSGSIIQSVNSEKGNLDRPSNIKEISEIISGPEGGWVEITVLNKKGEESNVRLIRKKIQLIDEWVHGETMEVNGKKIGIVTIPSFYKGDDKNVAVDVAHMMRLLNQKNIDAVIFDVRGNSGGDLESAVSIASFLIGKETAVVVIDASFRKQPVEGGGPILFKGPTAILIDGNSASASEVLAGAILDNGGDIIGKSHSYGKGTVQEIISLKPYFATNLTVMSWIGSLKCTVREFISPKGTKIDGVGFQPTILIKGTIDHPSEIKTGSIIQVNERLETVEEKNSISFDDSKMEAVERFALKLSR